MGWASKNIGAGQYNVKGAEILNCLVLISGLN
jgi:hypothetical protein